MSESNGYATREQAISPIVRRHQDVDVPTVGKVEIQTITEAERAGIAAYNFRKDGSPNLEKQKDANCRLIVIGTSKPQMSMADVESLRSKGAGVIDYWATAIAKLNNISPEELEKKDETPVVV